MYVEYYKTKLEMEISTYDLCLLILKTSSNASKGLFFGITSLQTNDMLNVSTLAFLEKE